MDSIEQKAKELVEKFRNEYKWVETDYPVDLYREAKQCAIICVDEILTNNDNLWLSDNELNYWQQVKERLLARQ